MNERSVGEEREINPRRKISIKRLVIFSQARNEIIKSGTVEKKYQPHVGVNGLYTIISSPREKISVQKKMVK